MGLTLDYFCYYTLLMTKLGVANEWFSSNSSRMISPHMHVAKELKSKQQTNYSHPSPRTRKTTNIQTRIPPEQRFVTIKPQYINTNEVMLIASVQYNTNKTAKT
jgi:hypothetical protein